MTSQFWWFLTRASGLVAWLMLTASVLWGIVVSSGAFPKHRQPRWLLALHRWLGGLTLSFLAVHLGALLLDGYVGFGIADVTVPYATDWRPGAVALGILAMWLLVAVELTSLAMRRLPRRAWRRVHLTSYVVFWSTSLHAAFAGTDASTRIYRIGAAISIVAVVGALSYRIASRRAARPPRNRAGRPAHDQLSATPASAERTPEVTP